MKFRFKGLLQNEGWLWETCIDTDDAGLITSINSNADHQECDEIVNGFGLPGFQNSHSHAFQYAMAGTAENHLAKNGADNFWSWRSKMYELANSINPDQFEAIAAMLFSELLRHGYTNVAEFHYLHHDISGKPYTNIAEMGERLVSAAEIAGISITLIPIFYQTGGFGKPFEEYQRRFISKEIDDYSSLFDTTNAICEGVSHANTVLGIHSLRAVEPDLIREVIRDFPKTLPFHIHISEQQREVEESKAYLGARPIEWMLDNTELSKRFHFVHATHANADEIYDMADMNINVVVCPSTEANLGDGIFPLSEFIKAGGDWSIGTDSHVSLNPFEELRLLDYSQRMLSNRRDTYGGFEDSGRGCFDRTLIAGRRAMNNNETDYFKIGEPLNVCVISAEHPLVATAGSDNLLNTIIYSSDETMQKGTIVNGEWLVENGHHIRQDEIHRKFVSAINELGIR